MQLTCPNCSARYEVTAAMIPAEGRHVQCSACHTRWFEKPAARVALSEDEILNRLEKMSPAPGPRLVAVPTPPPPPEVELESIDVEDDEPAVDKAPATVEPAAAKAAEEGTETVVPLTRAAGRTAPRLQLADGIEADPLPPPAPNRFAVGFGVALLLAAAAFAAYRFAAPLAAQVPAAGPALDGWEKAVDGLRSGFADAIGHRGG